MYVLYRTTAKHIIITLDTEGSDTKSRSLTKEGNSSKNISNDCKSNGDSRLFPTTWNPKSVMTGHIWVDLDTVVRIIIQT